MITAKQKQSTEINDVCPTIEQRLWYSLLALLRTSLRVELSLLVCFGKQPVTSYQPRRNGSHSKGIHTAR